MEEASKRDIGFPYLDIKMLDLVMLNLKIVSNWCMERIAVLLNSRRLWDICNLHFDKERRLLRLPVRLYLTKYIRIRIEFFFTWYDDYLLTFVEYIVFREVFFISLIFSKTWSFWWFLIILRCLWRIFPDQYPTVNFFLALLLLT